VGANWAIFSPLPEAEARILAAQYLSLVDQYLAVRPDCEDDWGEPVAGGPPPSAEELKEAYRHYSLPLPDDVLQRLATCRSTVRLDNPGALATEALQVSLLQHLLERTGKGLVMLDDYPLQASEVLLHDLAHMRHAPGFRDLPALSR
jgi:hypothetical protein